MALKDEWKNTGKNTGKAFANFGKALGKTMKTVFTDDENMIESNGHTEVSNAWRETGKAFGNAGKSFGKAMCDTFTGSDKDLMLTSLGTAEGCPQGRRCLYRAL